MAWIFVVIGGRVAIEDSGEISSEVMEDGAIKLLKNKAEEHGLVFEESHDSDKDVTSFFVGKEVHDSRHIYQGQTVCCDISAAPDPVFESIMTELKKFLASKDIPIIADDKGVIINQFD